MCATFDDGTSKSHCWKINSLFYLILICGQVDLFIFYFHFIVILILYFYFYFCHRWRWCLFIKELFLVDLFIWKKNATNVLCFFDASELIRIGIICIFDGSFFGIHCQRKKRLPAIFSKKYMTIKVVIVYSKNDFCTLSLQAPHVDFYKSFFLTTQVFYLGSLMMIMMVVVVMMMMIMINGCGQRLIFVWRINSRSFLSTIAFLLFTWPFLGKAKTWHVLVFHHVSVLTYIEVLWACPSGFFRKCSMGKKTWKNCYLFIFSAFAKKQKQMRKVVGNETSK